MTKENERLQNLVDISRKGLLSIYDAYLDDDIDLLTSDEQDERLRCFFEAIAVLKITPTFMEKNKLTS